MGIASRMHRLFWELPRNAVRFWQQHGTVHLIGRLGIRLPKPPIPPLPEPLSPQRAKTWHRQFPERPLFSLILPVESAASKKLSATIDSVIAQYYETWELILVTDTDQQSKIGEQLSNARGSDLRIRTIAIESSQDPAVAIDAGIGAARGEFVGFLKAEDQLSPDALTWTAAAHNRHPQAVWFYADEDRIDDDGRRSDPYFKPAFSAESLLSHNHTSGPSLYSTKLLKAAGGLRPGFGSAWEHDLALRLSEQAHRDEVVHIPRILYHRRRRRSSETQADEAQLAIRDALVRRGVIGQVMPNATWPDGFEIRFSPKSYPSVRILIATHNAYGDLKACLDSIHRHTKYPHFKITVIDNRSNDPELLAFLKRAESEGTLDVVRDPRPFNHSQMHNDAIADCREDYVVFMNNDVELLTPGWLGQLVAAAELDPSIAGAGALLLFPDRTVQHGGMVLGRLGIAGHLHRDLPEHDPGYFGQAHLFREVSAATAALLLMRRSAFVDVGGFDAERYPTSFNDVDLWVRLGQMGYRCLYHPGVRAIHHESKTREVVWDVEIRYRKRFRRQWATTVRFDPFSNPNLSLENETYPERRRYPIRSWKKELFRCLAPFEASPSEIEQSRAA